MIKSWINTIKKLSTVSRFSQTELAKKENVLEHTGMVALISLHIVEQINSENGFRVDREKVLLKAILHDIEESVIGDVSNPSKYYSDGLRGAFYDLEVNVAGVLFNESKLPQLLLTWTDAKNGLEGQIVAFADTLSAIIKFHDEIVLRGNRTMIPLLSPTAFETMFKKLSEINFGWNTPACMSHYRIFCENLKSELEKAIEN